MFATKLKSVAANIGIMLAITAAVKIASAAWDKFDTTVSEAQEDLDETQNTIKSLKEQIKELESIDANAITQGQRDKLENLKEQLKVQEQLEEIEKRRLARETIGNGNFADYFDKDSYKNNKIKLHNVTEDAKYNLNSVSGTFTSRQSYISSLNEQLVNTEGLTEKQIEELENSLKEANRQQNISRETILGIQENLITNKADIQNWMSQIQTYIDEGYLVGSDLTRANEIIKELQILLNGTNDEIERTNNLLYGGDDSIESVIAEKTKYTYQNLLDNGFTKDEIEILSTLTFDKNATFEELRKVLEEAQKKASNPPIEVPLKFSEQMSGVESLSAGLDQLDSIMADVINGEEFDYSSILNNDSFNDAFKKYGKEYEDFIQAVTESPRDISKCQQAFDNLATAYVNGSEALKDLTEETRDAAILELGQMGIKNAKEVVDSYLQIDRVKKEIENSGYDLANISYEEAYAFMQLSNASDTARNYLFAYYAQKLLINKNGINTVQDCIQLKNLANAAGYTGSALLYLAKIQSLLNKIDNENLVEGTIPYQAAYSKLTEYNNGLQKLLASEMKVADVQVDFGNGTKSLAAAQEKAADATDKVTDALEKEKSKLEDIKAEYDFLYDAVMWFYDKQIEKIDDKIDALNEENERLQKQQENMDRILAAIEANYDAEIKLIQDKIDALKDENDEEERALALEEAKRKLQEAKSRKTLMVYQKGVGFTYQVDTKAITEAEEELEELQENEVVAELEKQIEKLEEAKNKWSEIPEAYEKAMQEIAAMNYFGKNWKEITLNPSDSLLNKFEGKYTGIQSSIVKNEDRIEKYEKEKEKIEELKKAWEDAKNAYQYYQYETKLSEYFGSDYEYQLLNNSKVWRQQYAEEYSNLCAQIEALEQKIKAANDETANAATTNAQTIKTANEETVKSAEALSNSVSQAETATGSVIDAAGEKVDNIAQVINTLKDAIFNLITNINILYQTMTEIDTITLENLMAQFGTSSSNGSFEGGMVVTGVMTKPSEGSEGSVSGGSGLLGAINSVIEAVDKLKGVSIKELNDTELTDIINRFGVSGDNGATEGSLLSAINNVSNTITGEGNVESGLIPSIKELGSDATSGHIFKVQNSFHTLMQEITGVIKQVDALIDKINSIPKVPSIGGNSKGTGTAFTFGTGTAFSGTAYASGTGKWGLPSDKPGSLVAEQGSEIVVRDGKYRLISSPTLMDLKKGDIVFNHKQTEAILKNGKKSVIDNLANKSEKIVNNLNGFAYSAGTVTGNAFDAILNGLQLMLQPKNVLPKFAQKFKKLPNNPNEQKVEIHIGDIHVHGVQNVNGLADQIINHLPNTMLQKLNKK